MDIKVPNRILAINELTSLGKNITQIFQIIKLNHSKYIYFLIKVMKY